MAHTEFQRVDDRFRETQCLRLLVYNPLDANYLTAARPSSPSQINSPTTGMRWPVESADSSHANFLDRRFISPIKQKGLRTLCGAARSKKIFL